MNFTDDDLKRLREQLMVCTDQKVPDFIRDDNGYIARPYETLKMYALIARLEAAERYAWAFDPLNGIVDEKFATKARNVWRELAGK